MPVRSEEEYRIAIRNLFPSGEFWDRQFDDPDSDLSIWCRVKAAAVARFQQRRADLFDESVIDTATELIDDWERVSGLNNRGLTIEERRAIIKRRRVETVNWPAVEATIASFGGTTLERGHPYKPSILGFSTCGQRFATPATFNVVHIRIQLADLDARPQLEAAVTAQLMTYHIIGFIYS